MTKRSKAKGTQEKNEIFLTLRIVENKISCHVFRERKDGATEHLHWDRTITYRGRGTIKRKFWNHAVKAVRLEAETYFKLQYGE